MDCIVHRVTKSRTWLSDFHFTSFFVNKDLLRHGRVRVCLCVCACMRLVMSNALRPHWTVAHQLLCPWDFPGKNTGGGFFTLKWQLPPNWSLLFLPLYPLSILQLVVFLTYMILLRFYSVKPLLEPHFLQLLHVFLKCVGVWPLCFPAASLSILSFLSVSCTTATSQLSGLCGSVTTPHPPPKCPFLCFLLLLGFMLPSISVKPVLMSFLCTLRSIRIRSVTLQ